MDRRRFLENAVATALVCGTRCNAQGSPATEGPVVQTIAGAVRGKAQDGIASFLGVPYGEDTRKCRFQAPIAVKPWAGVREARTWADRSPQLGSRQQRVGRTIAASGVEAGFHLPPDEGAISEDCLHLNVWTPSARREGHPSRPVLFYIHGGAYNSGTVNCVLYDGTRLCRRGDAVVVTVNHRLNAFGYLYLGEVSEDAAYADSGNAGMLDLVLALRWVRDNIAAFGGDPERVTIFGQSGGGAKCATLMAMSAAHGLFHRVMTMSGQQVAAAPKTVAAARTRAFLEQLGLQQTPGDKLREALDAMPLEKLEDAARVSSAWLPVVDGLSLARDPFSPDAPALSSKVPMILGNTHDETRGLIGSAQPALFSLTWDAVPAALVKNVGTFLGPVKPEDVVAAYRAWYPAYTPSDVFFAAATAFRSWPGQLIEAERRAASPAHDRTWVYEMDWTSPVAEGRFGAPHTVDIPFFFDNLKLAPGMVGAGPEDLARAQPLADAMSATLLAFARTGTPNHAGLPAWPVYEVERRPTMIWNTPVHLEDDPRGRERAFAAKASYRQPGTY